MKIEKKLTYLMVGFILLFSFNVVSADYLHHKQNTDLEFSFTSNNATQCNLTTGNTPYGLIEINQEATKIGQTFNITIEGNIFSELGDYCFNLVCSDGSQIETGSVCREIRNTNLTYLIIMLSLASLFFLASLFVNEEFFVYISGVLFLVLGIYIMINGIDVVNDWYSRTISYVTIGIGLLFTIGAYIYNSYSKFNKEEEY